MDTRLIINISKDIKSKITGFVRFFGSRGVIIWSRKKELNC